MAAQGSGLDERGFSPAPRNTLVHPAISGHLWGKSPQAIKAIKYRVTVMQFNPNQFNALASQPGSFKGQLPGFQWQNQGGIRFAPMPPMFGGPRLPVFMPWPFQPLIGLLLPFPGLAGPQGHQGPAGSAGPAVPAAGESNLAVDGNTISVDGYEIVVTKDQVLIKDTETDEWVKAWGDPHVVTWDGDEAKFHTDNLTIDLPNGAKVTITPTEKNAAGFAWLDTVSVMHGDKGILVKAVHSNPQFGPITDAASVDARFEDGTVLSAKQGVDELVRQVNGREIIGTDHGGDWEFDGLGGASANEFADGVEGTTGFPSTSGMDILTRLMLILSRIGKQMQGTADQLEKMQGLKEKKSQMEAAKSDLTTSDSETVTASPFKGMSADDLTAGIAKLGDIDQVVEKLTTQVQTMMQSKQQVSQMITNLSKADHDSKMATVRNLRA
ncbi:MAG: hypothetical protein ACI841_000471 [Planctomycetota bacterium]|jgi:hypothetical protein